MSIAATPGPPLDRVHAMLAGGPRCAAPVLVLAAHPDDETIGASTVLGRCLDVRVIHLTDGAPRDPRFIPAAVAARGARYARLRRRELQAALLLAGIGHERTVCLGAPDQEAVTALPRLVRRVRAALVRFRPALLVTHAYEGGHPDHDAAAFVARAALELLHREGETGPDLVEMALYHGREGRLCSGEFLPESLPVVLRPAGRPLTVRLSAFQCALKRRMMDCFRSQRSTLQSFPIGFERLRIGPIYDFAHPPHSGPLWYEQLGWPLSGAAWRKFALAARAELELDGTPWLSRS
jgi:LmbE family N-acetylglucosaminyl deacetylase